MTIASKLLQTKSLIINRRFGLAPVKKRRPSGKSGKISEVIMGAIKKQSPRRCLLIHHYPKELVLPKKDKRSTI